jgi:hypothetical protein
MSMMWTPGSSGPSATAARRGCGRPTHPFGRIWALASVEEVLTPDRIAERMPRATTGV